MTTPEKRYKKTPLPKPGCSNAEQPDQDEKSTARTSNKVRGFNTVLYKKSDFQADLRILSHRMIKVSNFWIGKAAGSFRRKAAAKPEGIGEEMLRGLEERTHSALWL